MKRKATSLFGALLLIVSVFVLVGHAQNRERYGISAKAGGVNAVSGQVKVKRGTQVPQLLTSQDDLASGDVVTTAYGSQAEILLNPGTYLRLAEKSEFVMVDNSLDNLLVRLNRGSVIIEVTGPDQTELRVPIDTEQQRMTIVRAGIYRINVRPGITELFVRKGRMSLGTDRDNVVKSGKKVTFSSAGQAIAKLTKADLDEFDDWSKERGQTLARANVKLSTRALNSYFRSSVWGLADARFGRWGLWTWSPFSSCYTFVPFYQGWGSPYGSSYGTSAYFYGNYNYYPRNYNTPGNGNNSSSGNVGYGSPGTGSSSSSTGSSGIGYGSPGPSSTGPTYSPPPSAPSVNTGSQAGPRDPDSGSRSINRIKDPIN
jgi:FecR-like protein